MFRLRFLLMSLSKSVSGEDEEEELEEEEEGRGGLENKSSFLAFLGFLFSFSIMGSAPVEVWTGSTSLWISVTN